MVYIAKFFEECEECEMSGGKYDGKYAFSENIKGMDTEQWNEFVEGKIRGGCGTSFDCIIKHLLERIDENDVDIAIVFTDGYSSVNEKHIESFNQTNKKCYTIYFTSPGAHYSYGHGRYGKNQTNEMTSDLDKLNGDSFTIVCAEKKK